MDSITEQTEVRLDEDVIEATKVAESYAKVMTADFVISLSRKIEDKIGNTGRFHVIKNRFNPDGLTYPAKSTQTSVRLRYLKVTQFKVKMFNIRLTIETTKLNKCCLLVMRT